MFYVLKLIFCVTYVKQKSEYYFLLCYYFLALGIIFCVIGGNTNPQIFFKFFKQKQKCLCTGVNIFRYSNQKNVRKWFFAAKGFLRYLRQLKARKQSILRFLFFGAKKQMVLRFCFKIFERSKQFFVAEAQHFGAKTKCFWVRLVFCVI